MRAWLNLLGEKDAEITQIVSRGSYLNRVAQLLEERVGIASPKIIVRVQSQCTRPRGGLDSRASGRRAVPAGNPPRARRANRQLCYRTRSRIRPPRRRGAPDGINRRVRAEAEKRNGETRDRLPSVFRPLFRADQIGRESARAISSTTRSAGSRCRHRIPSWDREESGPTPAPIRDRRAHRSRQA